MNPSATGQPADGLTIDGAVASPQTLPLDRLRQFATQTQQVSFDSSAGPQSHTFEGPLLFDVLNSATPKPDPSAKNALLRLTVVVTGADGYNVTFAWGEIAPEFAGTKVLLAYTEDGRGLSRPRLTAPDDRKGGRYVTDVIRIRLVDPAS
ncbi:hypothetical protein [Nocardia sp. NPDC049707]|uniref:hypothetical protein n=1 Tax=Nocardia sp. NPDC049707 TaxID=3154735 RepID=UPI003425F581